MSGFYTKNPYSAEQIEHYEYATDKSIERLLGSSVRAQLEWAKRPLSHRLQALVNLASLLRAKKAELATLATLEMGKPIAQAEAEVEKCAKACAFYAQNAESMLADEIVPTEHRKSYVTYQPLGTILAIMPWNYPYWQVIRCAVPATVAGNTVVLKHADNTSGSALAIAALWREACGIEGIVGTLIADHESIAGVIADSRIRAVSLTGSERAGAIVASLAGRHLKKAVLELGGSDPYVVLSDADIQLAARVCAESRFLNNGQSCVAAKRFIVVAPVFEAFVEAFTREVKSRRVGDPMDRSVQIGPLARLDLRQALASQVESSVAKGARVLLGGSFPAMPGYFYSPTVLTDVGPGMAVFDEEVFGPVAPIILAENEDAAFKLANSSRFGLGAAIFSRDTDRAERLLRERTVSGLAVVNGMVVSDPRLPFGGLGHSGYGRELSRQGLLEFVNTRTVVVG